MPLRSLLFVPGDSESKLAGALRYGADALILDLEDSVAPARKPAARDGVREFLRAVKRDSSVRHYVRVNSLASGELPADLAAIMAGKPDGIVLPKGEPEHLRALDARLTVLEAAHGVALGSVKVIVIATETASAMFSIGAYGGISARLQALTWGGEDLAAVLGAVNRNPQGRYEDIFRLARALCALGASAAGVDAIDAACMDYNDLAAFEQECHQARRAGFVGKLAIHPRQVATINATFTPSAAEVSWARRVVEAFGSHPELGVVGIDGRVIDRPHLQLAERLLARL